jgi:hypothetical protein
VQRAWCFPRAVVGASMPALTQASRPGMGNAVHWPMAAGVAGSVEGQWCVRLVGSAFEDLPCDNCVEGVALRLVSWSLEDGGVGVIYVRTEQMLQIGWCTARSCLWNGPMLGVVRGKASGVTVMRQCIGKCWQADDAPASQGRRGRGSKSGLIASCSHPPHSRTTDEESSTYIIGGQLRRSGRPRNVSIWGQPRPRLPWLGGSFDCIVFAVERIKEGGITSFRRAVHDNIHGL